MQQLEQILFGVTVFAYLAAAMLTTFGVAYKRPEVHRVAYGALVVGFVAQTLAFALRWIDGGRFPVISLYETLVFFSWCTVLVYIVVARFYQVQAAGIILIPAAFFMLAVAVLLYEAPLPLKDELQSSWLAVHVGVSMFAYAGFALAFATGFFYVVQEDLLKKKYEQVRSLIVILIVVTGVGLGTYVGYVIADPTLFEDAAGNRVYAYSHSDWTVIGIGAAVGLLASVVLGAAAARGASRPSFANRLPPLHLLDRLSYHSVVFGFILLALGIVSGAVWAHAEWGEWWSWDPKETWALLAWLFYAAYLGLRRFANWRGRRSAGLAIVGMFLVMFAFLGINLFIPGLHDFN